MTDETTNELLSRHLDGDLASDEESVLQARIEAESGLKAELDAMRELRHSVASLASAERVPPELDQLVDPLLRGKPEVVVVRPWLQWLATAAAVVLGATVIIEFNRGNPGPSIESLAKAAKDSNTEAAERFTLAPLPTSSLPPEQQPLGAADRLLASPIAEVELDDPPALDVHGPTEAAEGDASLEEMPSAASAGVVSAPAAMAAQSEARKLGPEKNERPMTATGPKREREDVSTERGAGRDDALRPWDVAPPTGRVQFFIFIDGKTAWREFTPKDRCRPGRYAVRIVVARGAVREVRPVGGAASANSSQRLCAANLVLDLDIDGVADGEYPGEVVVRPRGADE